MSVRNRVAMAFLFGLLALSSDSVLAKDTQPAALAGAPTLAEIAKANDAAWAAIKSVDMVYDVTSWIVNNGKKGRELRSTDLRWSKEETRERYRGCVQQATIKDGDLVSEDRSEYEDYFLDGKTVRYFRDSDPKNKDKGELSCQYQKGLHAEIHPETPRMLADKEKSPQLLRYLRWSIKNPHGNMTNKSSLMLSEIINSDQWKVSLRGKESAGAGDTLWLIHAEYSPKTGNDELAGSYIDIYVNANKNFLIQKILSYATNVATKQGQPVGIYYTEEIREFQDCGHGVWFPKQWEYFLPGDKKQIPSKDGFHAIQTATRLSVNSPLPTDAFDFRLPKNMVVRQISAENDAERFLIWGPDNKPAKEFNTGEEFEKYAEKEQLEDMRQRVEKNRSSKKPSDLVERGEYCLATNQGDAAIAALSEALALDPKVDDALLARGLAYLVHAQDFANAIADFTECLRRAPEEQDLAVCHYLRGLAYASRKDGLDKANADMTEALRDPNIQECQAGAHLVCSVVQVRKGNLTGALADATKAVEVDSASSNADAHAVRSYIYEKKGDKDKATADREASKRLRAKAADSNIAEAMLAVALHRCLVQLLPGFE